MNMKKGFTLIEIMIVVAIIAILAAIAIPNFIKYRESAQKNSCEANKKAIVAAAEAYCIASNVTDKTSLTISTDLVANGTGFLKKAPTCPAGGTYTCSKSDTEGWTCTCSKH